MKDTWQYSELKQYLSHHAKDADLPSKTVFLANPQQKEELDKIISKHLWPAVLKGVGSSGIWIKSLKDGYPKSGIEDEKYVYTVRALTFLLEDPKRQLSFGSDVPWYCRGKILCSAVDYMISFDFFVYLPERFSLAKIVRLLKNPEFAGCPPELTFNDSQVGQGIFCVAFTKGNGAGWGLHTYEDAANRIREGIELNIDVIRAIYNLENNFKSTKEFNKLEHTLIRAFASG